MAQKSSHNVTKKTTRPATPGSSRTHVRRRQGAAGPTAGPTAGDERWGPTHARDTRPAHSNQNCQHQRQRQKHIEHRHLHNEKRQEEIQSTERDCPKGLPKSCTERRRRGKAVPDLECTMGAPTRKTLKMAQAEQRAVKKKPTPQGKHGILLRAIELRKPSVGLRKLFNQPSGSGIGRFQRAQLAQSCRIVGVVLTTLETNPFVSCLMKAVHRPALRTLLPSLDAPFRRDLPLSSAWRHHCRGPARTIP